MKINSVREQIAADTHYILDRDYMAETIRYGLGRGIETPIFDNLAAERFSRDSH